MVTLARWDDGYVLMQDSQRDDPVYYYAQRPDDVSAAIGFVVEPVFQEESRPNVTISFASGDHRARAGRLQSAARRILFVRVLQTLVAKYPHWTSIKWKTEDGDRDVAAELSAVMAQLGFRRTPDSSPHRPVWERPLPTPRPTVPDATLDISGERKLSLWLRLVALFLVWIGTRGFFFLLIGEENPHYRMLTEAGFGPAIWISELIVSTLAIAAGVAIWTRWRQAFMLATAALALYTAATFVGLQQASAQPERAKAAYAESRLARGLPVPQDRLDEMFSPGGMRAVWITGMVMCLTPYGVLLWRRRELEPEE
jgi:hypothetical protein